MEAQELFIGQYKGCKFDEKYRVVVPAKFRKQLQQDTKNNPSILRKDIYRNCLILTTINKWEQEKNSIINNSNLYPPGYYNDFVNNSTSITLDTRGRLLLPQQFQGVINMDGMVSFRGNNQQVEIWQE